MHKCYRRNGESIGIYEWAILFENDKYRRVALTRLPGGKKYVSTVWLGLNHSFDGGDPKIFETMVFSRDTRSMSLFGSGKSLMYHENFYQRQWTTEEEAYAGHASICRWWRLNRRQRRKWQRKLIEQCEKREVRVI